MLGHEATGFAGSLDLDAARERVREISEPVRVPRRPRRARRGPPGRRAAAGRDHQGALARRAGARLRRADRGAHAAGDRRADGDHAPAQGGRHGDRLHHPQAARGARGRRPDHRHPARQGRRRGQPDGDQRRARRADGRPRGRADGAQGRAEAGRRRAGRRGPHRHRRPRPASTSTTSASPSGPARSSPSPVCRATGRPSSPRRSSGCRTTCAGSITPRRRRARRPLRAPDPRRRRRVRPRGPPGGRAGRRVHHRREPHARPQLRRAVRQPRVPAARTSSTTSPSEKLKEFDVRAPGITTLAGQLSGGNQQKVVLARELSRDLRLLVAAQPTRGVDVGSIEFIHKHIVATRDAGVPVLVVSTELDEVVALADRIMVIYRGRIVGIVPGDTPREVLGLMMAGERPEGASRMSERQSGPSSRPRREPRGGSTARGTRAAGARLMRDITAGSAMVARARRPPRRARRFAADRASPTRRSGTPRATSSPGPSDFFQATWDAVWGAYTALFRGSIYNSRAGDVRAGHPAAHRDAQVRRPADRGRPRRRARVPRRPVQHRWPRADAARRRRRRLGRLPVRPAVGHPPDVAILAGMVAGALWAGIAGLLKARTGAHEVIVTIMLNYVALLPRLLRALRQSLLQAPGSINPKSPPMKESATMPQAPRRPVQPAPRLPAGPRRRRVRRGGCSTGPRSASGSAPSARTRAPRGPRASTSAAPTSSSC